MMEIEEKANIDTLLIAAEVLERNLVKNAHFQRDSLPKNAQRKYSAAYTALIASNIDFHSPSSSPSASRSSTPSRRHWLSSDLIISGTPIHNHFFTSSSDISIPDTKTVLSSRSRSSSSSSSSTNNNNDSASLVPSSYSESPESWQVRSVNSPAELPVSYTSNVAPPTTSSSCSVSDTGNTLPLRQLRTALLSEHHVGRVKTQRASSNVNPPWSNLDFFAQAADLVRLSSASVVTGSEKAVPRLPAKKRKFDWGERSNGDSSLIPPVTSQSTSVSSQPQPALLIVDKPAQLGLDNTRRFSAFSLLEPSITTSTSPFYYSASQCGVSRLEVPMKQHKSSYPDLSFTSDTPSGFAFLRPHPQILGLSAQTDAPYWRSSLVPDDRNVNNYTTSNNNATSTSTSSCSSPRISMTAAKSINHSPSSPPPQPLPPSTFGCSWGDKFPSSTSSSVSALGTPSSLASDIIIQQATTRRHSFALPTARSIIPPSSVVAFNSVIPIQDNKQQQQQQRQQQHQARLTHDVQPLGRSPIPVTDASYDFGAVCMGTRPLSTPKEPVTTAWSSLPLEAQRPPPSSAASSLLPSITGTQIAALRERTQRMGQISVLGAILSLSAGITDCFATLDPETSYSQSPPQDLGDGKLSFDSVFPITKTRGDSGPVILSGEVACRLREKSFDRSFPLLLVSASTSASVIEFASAMAAASGAPASSLIPVPVQLVSNSVADSTASTSASSTANIETGVALVSKTTNEADQRLIFPLVPISTSDGQMSGRTLGFPLLVPNLQKHSPSPPI